MSSHNFTIDFKSLKLTSDQKNELLASVNEALSRKINDLVVGVVTVSVLFQRGTGAITAVHKRAGKRLATGQLDQSGTIALAVGAENDLILIDGSCQGTATLTINLATERATPVDYKSGLINEIFELS